MLPPHGQNWGVHWRIKLGWGLQQNNWFHLTELFWNNQMNSQYSLLSPTDILPLLHDIGVALDLAWEGAFLDLYSENKLHSVSQ